MTLLRSTTSRDVTTSKRRLVGLAVVAAIALLVFLPSAGAVTDNVWNGTTNTNWATATNWSLGHIPVAGERAVVPPTANNPTVSTNVSANVPDSVALSGAATLTIAAGGQLSVSGDISAPVGTNVTVSGGILKFNTLTAGGPSQLTLSSGTIVGQINSPGNTITNAGVNYGTAPGDTVTLGPSVTLDHTGGSFNLQGTLSIPSGTLYKLDGVGASIAVGGGTPVISVGGELRNLGSGTDTLAPEVDITGLVNNASTGILQLTNTATGASPNKYGGTIANTGGGTVVLGGSAATGAGGQVQPGGLITQNTGGGGGILIQPSATALVKDFDLNGQTVTMNGGPLTIDGQTNGGAGVVKGGAPSTFRSGNTPANGGNCSVSSSCQLLLHAARFNTAANVTIAGATATAPATNAVVETVDDPFDNKFDLNVNGNLILSGRSITTAATGGNVPTIHITGTMSHTGASASVQVLIDQTGLIADNSTSNLTLTSGAATGTNIDKLSGTLQTQSASSTIRLGGPNQTLFQLQGNLTVDSFTGGTSNCTGGGGTIATNGTNPTLQLDDGVTARTLTINGRFIHSAGQIVSGVNGTDNINGPGTVTCSGVPTTAGTGEFDLAGSPVTISPGGPLAINAPVIQSIDATIAGAGGNLIVNGTWTNVGANINYSGTAGTKMTVNGNSLRYTGSGGHSVKVPLTVNGTLEDAGSGTWTIDSTNGGTCTPVASCVTTISPTGTVKATSGTLKITGTPAGSSLTNLSGNTLTDGTWRIATGGELQLDTKVNTLAADLSIDGAGSLVDNSASLPGFRNLGLITSSGSPPAKLTLSGNHTETTNGLINVAGTLALLGTSTLDNTGCACTTTINPSGLLSGTGTFKGLNVSNSGVVKPGGSPGTLNITGNFIHNASGKLNVELAGTPGGQFGKLQVTGNVDLVSGSTVAFLPTAGYAASAQTGDVFPFLVYFGTRTGSFSNSSVTPPLNNSKPITLFNNDPGKEVDGVVGQGAPPPPPPPAPPHVGPTTTTPPLTTTTTTTVVTPKDTTKPVLSGVGLRASSFKRSKGTKLNVSLSENATVTVAITRRVGGRRRNGRCRTTNRTGPRCTIVLTVRTLSFTGKKGANSFTFKPSITPRGYTASITAKDAAGNKSKTTTRGFTVRSG